MNDLKQLSNTIEFLKQIEKEQKEKQFNELKDKIKNELLSQVEDTLLHFESDELVKFINNSGIHVCFDYNYMIIEEFVKENLRIDVWEVE